MCDNKMQYMLTYSVHQDTNAMKINTLFYSGNDTNILSDII